MKIDLSIDWSILYYYALDLAMFILFYAMAWSLRVRYENRFRRRKK